MSAVPTCANLPQWAESILDLTRVQPLDVASIATGSPEAEFHTQLKQGPTLRELQNQRFHLAYWEAPLYRRSLEKLLADVPRQSAILDLGCGDGRFTHLLLELGFERIVALDQHAESLARLADSLDANQRDKVAIVPSDILAAPIRDGSIGAVMAMGVLYYLDDRFESALDAISRWSTSQAALIHSLPSVGAAAMLALLFEGLEALNQVATNQRWFERHGETLGAFRAFRNEEVDRLHCTRGWRLIASHPLSALPLLVRILQVRGVIPISDLESKHDDLVNAFSQLDGLCESSGLTIRRFERFG